MGDNDVVQVYVAQQPQQAHFLCNLLADSGIEARVLGEPLALAGPPASTQSGVLWVRRQDAERARQILTDWEQEQSKPHTDTDPTATWKCAACGELVDDEFELCWNCQNPRRPY